MAEAGAASLLMRLDSGTQVHLDGSYFGNSPGVDRFLLMQRLTPGNHNLTLITSPEREQRFRVKLFSGRQIFDIQSGELRAVIEVQPPPDFLAFPSNLPHASENAYRGFRQALWEEKLIEPAGMSAWDYFQQLRDGVPSELRDSLKNRLAVSMGDRAQRTILKYLRGGDIKWNAAAFEEGAALAGHAQRLHRATTSLQSQERFFQGRALIEKGQYSQAVQQLQEAVKLDPAASHAYNALGLALWKQNLLMQAIAPLQQAIALSPAWTYPRNTLGLIYLEQRRYQEAAQSFQSSIELNDEDSMAYHCQGQLHLLLGRWQEAETQLQRAVEVTPGNAYAYGTLGRLYQQLQQWSKAEQMFRLAIRLEPEEPSFHLGLAELLQRAGRPEEAQSVFVRMMKQYPASPLVLQAYAAFLAAQKNSVEGERLYRQAVQLAPNDPNAHVRLGLFLQQQARSNDAAVEFKAAIQIAPDNPYAHYNLAVTYLAQKKIPEAEKELAAAVNADPRYSAPPFLLGQIRFAQKRYQEALKEYSSALGLSIEVHQQQEIKEKIQEAENALVAEKIEEAKGRMERKEYAASWSIFAELLKTTQGERRLRDAILQFQDEHFAAADLSALPPCKLSEILKTSFWKEQIQAEQLWRQGQKDQALRAFLAAIGALKREERPSLLSVYFNLGNVRFGIHPKVCLWALRFIEGRDYSGAMRLLDEANRQNIFGVVPGISPLTIDSLMIPPENPEPKQFSDFDVAHHPDRGVHEAYAAAHAGMGNLGEVGKYLMALETAKPNLPARMAVARVFQQEQKWDSAIALLKECLTSADITAYKDLLPEVFILLADIQCQAADCAAGRDTLEAGLKLSPDSKAIKEAMQRMKSPSRRNQ
jgi:tetratricopeptide (TPR) repeat protein